MRISELPRSLGGIALSFELGREEAPVVDRAHRSIGLPMGVMAFAVLNGGRCAVVQTGTRSHTHTWFVGEDDTNPFASRLVRPVNMRALVTPEGERHFLRGLMPRCFQLYQQQYGGQAERQGDVWRMPLTLGKPALSRHLQPLNERGGLSTHYNAIAVNDYPLQGTRHRLTGFRYVRKDRTGLAEHPRLFASVVDIVIGEVTAPDHPPFKVGRTTLVTVTDAFARTGGRHWGDVYGD